MKVSQLILELEIYKDLYGDNECAMLVGEQLLIPEITDAHHDWQDADFFANIGWEDFGVVEPLMILDARMPYVPTNNSEIEQ